MRVVVNQLAALGQRTGVGHYTGELLRCLTASPDASTTIDRYPSGWLRRGCKIFTRARPLVEGGPTLDRRARRGVRRACMDYLRNRGRGLVGNHFRSICALRRYDVYHEPNFIPFQADCPTVATLHDLSVLLHPEWHPADRVRFHETNFHRRASQCAQFLTVSEFIRQQVIHTLHLPAARVTCVYNGVRPTFRPMAESESAAALRHLGLPSRYLLYLGTIEPRKNVLMLLRAYCALPLAVRSAYPLVLVGGWGWNAGAVADYLASEARHRGVIQIGYIRDRYLAAVYNRARALVYPSWYEGFGLPPLEMMACGGAVLASTAGALVETVGGQAHLIPPEDATGWRQALERVCTDDEWWGLLRRGARAVARPYTWERAAVETAKVYRQAFRPSAMTDARPRVRVAG